MKARELFVLWLMGFGFTPTEAETIADQPRVKASLDTRDAGGLVQDLDREMPRELNPTAYAEWQKAFATPYEKLLLMQLFNT